MKKLITTYAILILSMNLIGQENLSDKAVVESIAKNILKNTTYTIVDPESGKSYTSFKNLEKNKNYRIGCPYLVWEYWNGVLNLAMLELYEITNDESYKLYSIKNYQFVFDNLLFFESMHKAGFKSSGMEKFFEMSMLDDCGAMGAGLLDVYQFDKKEAYSKYADKAADFIYSKEVRLEDGTLARLGPYNKTVWLDDLYMSIPFLARYAKLTGDTKYFDFSAKQIKQFTKYLYDPCSGIYFHCYFSNTKENGVARWGRANGWSMMAQVNLLNFLPENHPDRDTLVKILRQQIVGLARYQSESGLWHQLLDKQDSYLETSCSAMFTYAIAKAVNKGWLDERFRTIALRGWDGLKTKIQADGQVKDICVGTWILNDLVFYYKRPTQLNDIHGLGAVLLAGVEILKLKEKWKD